MDPIIGSALIGAGAGIVDTLFSGVKAKKQYKYDKMLQEQAQQHSDQQATVAYNRQLEFYDRQLKDSQEWNDPTAVKERYKAAGLNPTSAFGTAGSYTPQQVPSAPSVQQGATVPPVQGYSPLGNVDPLDAILKAVKIGSTIADAEKTKGDTLDPDVTRQKQALEVQMLEKQLISQDVANEQQVFNLEFDKAVADTRKKTLSQTLSNLEKQNEVLAANYREAMTAADKNEADIKLIDSQILVNDARISLMKVKEDESRSLTAKQWQQVANLQDDLLTNAVTRQKLGAEVRELKSRYENNMQDAALKRKYQAAVKLDNALKELEIDKYDVRFAMEQKESRSRRFRNYSEGVSEYVRTGGYLTAAAMTGGLSTIPAAAMPK